MRDADVRIAVRSLLTKEHQADSDTRVVEEMGIWNGAVRVDVAVINGEMAGYEIKSARDTLTRLPAQAALYSEVFDRMYLVAAERHLSNACAEIPEWWGIIAARSGSESVELSVVRPSNLNPSIQPVQLARLLWRDEAIEILERRSAAKGVKRATRERVIERLVEKLNLDELRDELRSALKTRQAWLGQAVSDQRDMAIS